MKSISNSSRGLLFLILFKIFNLYLRRSNCFSATNISFVKLMEFVSIKKNRFKYLNIYDLNYIIINLNKKFYELL